MLDRHEDWLEKQSRWMSRRFRVEAQEAYQVLALALCQGMNRRHAKFRAIRTLVRESASIAYQGPTLEAETEGGQVSDLERLALEVLQGVELELVQLHAIHGLSLRSAAIRLSMNRETARRLYHAAISTLRDKLGETQ